MPVITPVFRKPARRVRRKRDEAFTISINYNGTELLYTVKSDYPAGPECMGWDYDIFQGRKHLYTLNHCKNEDEVVCWEIKKKPSTGHDPELVKHIGLAILKYYGE